MQCSVVWTVQARQGKALVSGSRTNHVSVHQYHVNEGGKEGKEGGGLPLVAPHPRTGESLCDATPAYTIDTYIYGLSPCL